MKRAPHSTVPWTGLAFHTFKQGDIEQALSCANRAVSLNPDQHVAHNTIGLALLHFDDLVGAEQAFQRAVSLSPDEVPYWSNLAVALRGQGRLEEARRILEEEALARDPTSGAAHLGLGLVHLAAIRPGLAVEPLRQAVYYQPQRSEPWEFLVIALVAAGQGSEAIEIMAQSPFASSESWFYLGNSLLDTGQAAEALRAYDHALTGWDAAAVHLQRGLAFALLDDWDKAESGLREGLVLAPVDGRLHNGLGIVLRERGDLGEALAAFQEAWRLTPDLAEVAGNLARTYEALGYDNEASEWRATADQLAAQE